jgi:hypothetical protein
MASRVPQRDAGSETPSGTQCCFCGAGIVPAGSDPVVLTLPVTGGGTQALYAHLKCLRAALHPSVPLGVFED